MSDSAAQTKNGNGSAFEWWMVSFIAAGAGWAAFISLLIPPFVTEATGNAADAGIVMAVISLAAVLAPVLGGFADKYRAHRLVLSLGVLGMALGFLMYSISAESTAIYALDAIVLGVSAAAINAVGPVFVLGANLPQKLEASRLTVLSLLQPVGQVIGGALLAAERAIRTNEFEGRRKSIDVSGDGPNNSGVIPSIIRDRVVDAGVTINGLAILNESPFLDRYYRREVIGGPNSFVMTLADYEDFVDGMRRKLIREISSALAQAGPSGGSRGADDDTGRRMGPAGFPSGRAHAGREAA